MHRLIHATVNLNTGGAQRHHVCICHHNVCLSLCIWIEHQKRTQFRPEVTLNQVNVFFTKHGIDLILTHTYLLHSQQAQKNILQLKRIILNSSDAASSYCSLVGYIHTGLMLGQWTYTFNTCLPIWREMHLCTLINMCDISLPRETSLTEQEGFSSMSGPSAEREQHFHPVAIHCESMNWSEWELFHSKQLWRLSLLLTTDLNFSFLQQNAHVLSRVHKYSCLQAQ